MHSILCPFAVLVTPSPPPPPPPPFFLSISLCISFFTQILSISLYISFPKFYLPFCHTPVQTLSLCIAILPSLPINLWVHCPVQDGSLLDTSSRKYQTQSDKRRTVHFTGTLRVRDVAREDYGNYNCTATNSKGSDNFQISLHGTSGCFWLTFFLSFFFLFVYLFICFALHFWIIWVTWNSVISCYLSGQLLLSIHLFCVGTVLMLDIIVQSF